jgi:hypothetical protein
MSDVRELAEKIGARHIDHDWNSPNLILRSNGSGKLIAKAFEPAVADFIVAAARYFASPPAADPLDVERLAEALHAVGVGCSSYICEPTTSTYIGLSKTMHETDAREVAAEYARLAREGEQR